MKRYRVLNILTNEGGEINAENGPQACKSLGLNYMECLWIRIKNTKGFKPTKYYVGSKDNDQERNSTR